MTDAKKVIIYTTGYCPYCSAAKSLLEQSGMKYEEINVENDDALRAKMVQMSGGRETVPQIFIDGKSIGGSKELAEYLKEHGGV